MSLYTFKISFYDSSYMEDEETVCGFCFASNFTETMGYIEESYTGITSVEYIHEIDTYHNHTCEVPESILKGIEEYDG